MNTLHLGDKVGTSQANIAETFYFFLIQVGSIIMYLSFELHTQDFVLHDWNVCFMLGDICTQKNCVGLSFSCVSHPSDVDGSSSLPLPTGPFHSSLGLAAKNTNSLFHLFSNEPLLKIPDTDCMVQYI